MIKIDILRYFLYLGSNAGYYCYYILIIGLCKGLECLLMIEKEIEDRNSIAKRKKENKKGYQDLL